MPNLVRIGYLVIPGIPPTRYGIYQSKTEMNRVLKQLVLYGSTMYKPGELIIVKEPGFKEISNEWRERYGN